jgi:sphinganine-1-phosphate aldolase
MNKLSAMNNIDKDIIGGPNTKITGSIYVNSGEVESLVGEVCRMYGYANLLHPDIFCSARYLESQLIKLALELFNGDKDRSCGITTSGGTESILFACLAYRNRGYKMGIRRPEM